MHASSSSYGADVTARADNGLTPLHRNVAFPYRAWCGHDRPGQLRTRTRRDTAATILSEVARFLSEHGAYATQQPRPDKQNPLLVAADEETEETAPILVRQGAGTIALDNNRLTQLHGKSGTGKCGGRTHPCRARCGRGNPG